MENTKVFQMYPRSAALGLRFVRTAPNEEHDHDGFDGEEVNKALGDARYAVLMELVAERSSVFVCGHREYSADHELKGCEVHCLYAKDVERFLEEAPHA